MNGGLEGENIPSTFIYPKKELPGSSHQQPTRKNRIKATKISQVFPPLWHPCDHKQTSLVSGGKYSIYLFRSTTDYLLLGRGTTIPRPTLNFPPHLVSGTSAKATKVTRKILPQTSPMWHIVGVTRCCCSAYIVSSSQKNPTLTLGPQKNNPHHPNSYPSNQGTWTQSTHNLCSAEHAGCPNGSDWNRTQATAPDTW